MKFLRVILCLVLALVAYLPAGAVGADPAAGANEAAADPKSEPKERADPEHDALVKEAASLLAQGKTAIKAGKYDRAEELYRKSLAVYEKAYPSAKYPNGHRQLAIALNNMGALFHAQNKPAEAVPYYEKAVEMGRRLIESSKSPERYRDLRNVLWNLADALQESGKPRLADKCLQEALTLMRSTFPADRYPDGHCDLADCLMRLGTLHRELHKYELAEEYYSEALSMRRKLYPSSRYPNGHEQLATVLNEMGALFHEQNKAAEAVPYLKKAVEMRYRLIESTKSGKRYLDLRCPLRNLAIALQQSGKLDSANEYLQQSLSLARRLFPTDRYPNGHVDLAQLLMDLGTLHEQLKKHESAEEYYSEALAMQKRLYPPAKYPSGHIDVIVSVIKMGDVLRAQQEYEEAATYYLEACDMQERLSGDRQDDLPGNRRLAAVLFKLGKVFEAQTEYELARLQLQRSLAIFKRLYPEDQYPAGHADLATVLGALATVHQTMGRYKDAKACREEVVEMRRRMYPKKEHPQGHAQIAISLNELGVILKWKGDHEQACECFEEATAMLRSLFPKDKYPQGAVLVSCALSNWGDALHAIGKDDQACERCKEALDILRKIYPPEKFSQGSDLLSVGIRNLGTALGTQGDVDAAKRHLDEALAMQQKLYPKEKYPLGHFRLADTFDRFGDLALLAEKNQEAYEYFKKSLAMCRDLYPADKYPYGHPRVVKALRQVADVAKRLGNEKDKKEREEQLVAAENLLKSRAYWESRTEPEYSVRAQEARALHTKGWRLHQQQRYSEAENYFRRALRIREELFPEDKFPQGHADLALSLNWMGVVLYKLERYEEAKTYYERVLAMRRRLYPATEHPQGHACIALDLTNLGDAYKKLHKYDAARKSYDQGLEMRRRLYPKDKYPNGHCDIAASINRLGTLFDAQNKHDEARKYYEQAVPMYRQLFPKDKYPNGCEQLATSMNNLACVLEAQGQHEAAEKYFQEVRKMPSGLAEHDRRRMLRLLDQGVDDLKALRAAAAIDHLTRAIEVTEKLYPKDRFPSGHADIAKLHGVLAAALLLESKFVEARNHVELALEMLDAASTDTNMETNTWKAQFLDVLATIVNLQGEEGQAKEYRRQAGIIQRRLANGAAEQRGPGSQPWGLKDYDKALMAQGKFKEAEQFLIQRLESNRRKYPLERFPAGHDGIADTLGSLGALYRKHGDKKKAEKYMQEEYDMRCRLHASSDSIFAVSNLFHSALSLGDWHKEQQKYEEANRWYQRALDLAKDARKGEGVVELAAVIVLDRLAQLAVAQTDYQKAREYYKQSLGSLEKMEGLSFWQAAFCERYGTLLLRRGKYREAYDILNRAARLQYESSEELASVASEAEALNFIRYNQTALGGLISAWQNTKVSADEVYARVWEGHGISQRVLAQRQQLMLKTESPEERKLYEEYMETRRALGNLTSIQATLDFAQKGATIDQARTLSRKKEQLERRLAAKVPDLWDRIKGRRVSRADLVQQLPEGNVFIHIVRYSYLEAAPKDSPSEESPGSPRYSAFLLRNKQAIVHVDLGAAGPIDLTVTAFRMAITQGRPDGSAAELRQLVWEPLDKQLDGIHTVYICPDGTLTSVPWGALPGREANQVLLEKYSFAIVPGGEFLVQGKARSQPPTAEQATLLAVGDVSYDEKPDDKPQQLAGVNRGGVVRGEQQLPWPDLPGTKHELAQIAALFNSAAPVDNRRALMLTAAEASPARVLTELPKARWAHLGTHGFFAHPRFLSVFNLKEKTFKKEYSFFSGQRTYFTGRNPLLLSGLVLAGANLASDEGASAISQRGRGILSAEAIAALPLENLELVVLSACETGLGDVAGGEGVFGLQRAFHLAGAHNVISSLWKVNDGATAFLMKEFYGNLWGKPGCSSIEALRKAQLTVYRHPEKVAQYARDRGIAWESPKPLPAGASAKPSRPTSPIKWWAAFVLSGPGR